MGLQFCESEFGAGGIDVVAEGEGEDGVEGGVGGYFGEECSCRSELEVCMCI